MNNKKINSLGFASLTIFPIISLTNSIGLYNIIKASNQDAYISVIISSLLGILVLIPFLIILNYKKDLTLKEKINFLFGNTLGTIINTIITFIVFIIGITIIYNSTNFINSQFLNKTPIYIILLLFNIPIIYNVTKGIETISRISLIILIITVFLTIISVISLSLQFNINNIKPILEFGITKPIHGSISLLLTCITPMIILLMTPKNNIIDSNKTNKYIIIFYLISMIFLTITTFLKIGVLGINLLKISNNPEYMVLKKISVLGFINRIENIIYIKSIFYNYINLVLIIYFISNNIKKKDIQKKIPIIVTLFISILSQIIFKNNIYYKFFIYNTYPYINLILLIIIILTTINIIIRKKIFNKQS